MTRSKLRQEERRWRRGDLAAAVAAIVLGAAIAWIVLTVQDVTHDLQISNKARDALARQVQQLGKSPVAGPPGSRGEPGKSVTGPSGSRGPQGPKGDNGDDGSPGPSGSPGQPGSPGRNGEDGGNGSNGEPGGAGPTGAAGAAGPPGPQGEPGPQGPPGADGKDGTDGRDGQACPSGYSLQAPTWDPDALVCRRDGAPQPDQPAPGSSSLLLGLPADRRRIA